MKNSIVTSILKVLEIKQKIIWYFSLHLNTLDFFGVLFCSYYLHCKLQVLRTVYICISGWWFLGVCLPKHYLCGQIMTAHWTLWLASSLWINSHKIRPSCPCFQAQFQGQHTHAFKSLEAFTYRVYNYLKTNPWTIIDCDPF